MKVKELREALELSKEEFAAKVGASFRSIYLWELADKEINNNSIGRAFRLNMRKLSKKIEED